MIGLTSQPFKVACVSLRQKAHPSFRKHIQSSPLTLSGQSGNTDTVTPLLQNLVQMVDWLGAVEYAVFLFQMRKILLAADLGQL